MAEAKKVLCVDDERNVLKALRRLFLDDEDYDVIIAESGEEGLEILAEQPDVRLVMSDYRMPQMNGVEFLRKVYEQWPDTLRIVLSGYADTAAVVEAINQGQIYKFIPKPWNDEELLTNIKTALEHQALQWENRQLSRDLQQKNDELQAINNHLEEQVMRRTEALEIRNQVLQVAQGILDVLPVAVFGIDTENLIVHCNDLAHDLFPCEGSGPLGNYRSNVFSAEINQLLDRFGEDPIGIELHGQSYRIEVHRLHQAQSQGTVLTLIPEASRT
jgi:two-component system NtrC family sensor kinase